MAGDVRGQRDGHCSGRDASYWNAFLFWILSLFPYILTTVCDGVCVRSDEPKKPLRKANGGFHKLDEIGNNANIGIRGFTT